jgi:hypothetical protein
MKVSEIGWTRLNYAFKTTRFYSAFAPAKLRLSYAFPLPQGGAKA